MEKLNGQLLREFRERHNLTQKQAAIIFKTTQQHISDIEKNKRGSISAAMLIKMQEMDAKKQ